MEQVLISPKQKISPGNCIPKQMLTSSGITPTNIDCFEYSPYVLYKNGIKRYVLQPMPFDQYKVIKIYNFVPANYS